MGLEADNDFFAGSIATDRTDATLASIAPTLSPVVNGSPATTRRYRVAFYSHDTMGLGHLRRNLLVAHTLSRSQVQAISLLVAGVREATSLTLPVGGDCMTLPALRKGQNGRYEARNLDLPVKDVIAIRARVIRAAIEAFEPDVMIVDNVPRGALRELEPTLQSLRAHGRTRCVLGLRDVLDTPAIVRQEWSRMENEEAVVEYFDEVWAYADPAVYNVVRECGFSPEVASKVRFAGYLDQRARLEFDRPGAISATASLGLSTEKFVLCSVGGGQDGAVLAQAFTQAQFPPNTSGVILTGPFMPPETMACLHRAVAANPLVRMIEFCPEPARLVREAERVVIMGGYNSVCEALSFEKPALIVPRIKPRAEQLIRAEAMRAAGVADLLHPDQLSPQALTRWLSAERPRPTVHGRIDFNGLAALPIMFQRLLNDSTGSGVAIGAV